MTAADALPDAGAARIGGFALFREAAAGIAAVRSRSALALVGVAVGIGAVIAMVSVGEVAREESLERFRALGTDTVTARAYYSVTLRREVPMPLETVLAVAGDLPEVAEAAGWNDVSATASHAGLPLADARIAGVAGAFARVAGLATVDGRFLSDLDFRRYFCVVGARVAREIRERSGRPPVGQRLRMNGRLWTVVGVLAEAEATRLRGRPDDTVYVPATTAALFDDTGGIVNLRARAAPGVAPERAAEALAAYFEKRVPGIVFGARTARDLIGGMRYQRRLFTLLLAAIGAVSLVVGAVGIMNTMLLGVSERQAEIGLRRAVGARARDIRRQFLLESVLLCLAGGAIGIAVGTAAAWAICLYAGWPFFVSASAGLSGVGVATAVGVFCGLYPAHRAAAMDPIEALRG